MTEKNESDERQPQGDAPQDEASLLKEEVEYLQGLLDCLMACRQKQGLATGFLVVDPVPLDSTEHGSSLSKLRRLLGTLIAWLQPSMHGSDDETVPGKRLCDLYDGCLAVRQRLVQNPLMESQDVLSLIRPFEHLLIDCLRSTYPTPDQLNRALVQIAPRLPSRFRKALRVKGVLPLTRDTEAMPSGLGLDVHIDPGEAHPEAIQDVFLALSELHRAAGGTGLTFSKDTLGVFEMAGVTV